MSTAIPVHVALVDDTSQVGHDDLAHLAGALNEQVLADFGPIWHVAASVGVYPPQAVPPGTWAIHLQHGIDAPGAAGYHSDSHRQPYAKVDITAGDWTVTVSHELLEMLADPFGSRMHSALGPLGTDFEAARVHYLLEVCDPCEATSYAAGGLSVSDFLLPGYYRSSAHPRLTLSSSFAHGVTRPREVADGGYVSFATATSWYQVFNEGGKLDVSRLGSFDGSTASLREWTDIAAREHRASR